MLKTLTRGPAATPAPPPDIASAQADAIAAARMQADADARVASLQAQTARHAETLAALTTTTRELAATRATLLSDVAIAPSMPPDVAARLDGLERRVSELATERARVETMHAATTTALADAQTAATAAGVTVAQATIAQATAQRAAAAAALDALWPDVTARMTAWLDAIDAEHTARVALLRLEGRHPATLPNRPTRAVTAERAALTFTPGIDPATRWRAVSLNAAGVADVTAWRDTHGW